MTKEEALSLKPGDAVYVLDIDRKWCYYITPLDHAIGKVMIVSKRWNPVSEYGESSDRIIFPLQNIGLGDVTPHHCTNYYNYPIASLHRCSIDKDLR